MPAGRRLALAILTVLALPAASHPHAQGRQSVDVRVTETSGIRRTEYPVRAEIRLPERNATDINRFQLLQADAPVPAQFTVMSIWPDGSARTVDVDFNITMNPSESRAYQIVYGADVSGGPGVPRGLTVTDAGAIRQINSTGFGIGGAPLIASAQYARADFINQAPQAVNTFAVVDTTGARHELATARDFRLETLKSGPLVGMLRFSGQMPIGGGVTPFTVTIEMPNSKSWVKVTADVSDPERRVRDLELATPLAMGAFPWTWDFGTENGTYGSFRSANDAVTFTQVVGTVPSWKIETGKAPDLRPYESSIPASGTTPRLAAGWGHLVGATTAVAFGIDALGATPGTYAVSLNGQGQATYRFSPSGTGTAHRFGVYQHFVSTPVPVGAATTPMSMLHPPVVTVEK